MAVLGVIEGFSGPLYRWQQRAALAVRWAAACGFWRCAPHRPAGGFPTPPAQTHLAQSVPEQIQETLLVDDLGVVLAGLGALVPDVVPPVGWRRAAYRT